MKERLRDFGSAGGNAWMHRQPVRQLDWHHHTELEINLAVAGTATLLVGQERFDLQPGDLVFLFPSAEHVLVNQSPDVQIWMAVFRPGLIRAAAVESENRPLRRLSLNGSARRRLRLPELDCLRRHFEWLVEPAGNPDRTRAGLMYLLLEAWRLFGAAEAAAPTRKMHVAVSRAVALLRCGGADDSLSQVAGEAGISPGRLSRLFAEETGCGFSEFRTRCRLERFYRAYDPAAPQNLLTLALEAGFGSYPQFYRAFREANGCGPGELTSRGRS